MAKDGCCHTYHCYFGCDESQEEDKTRIAIFPFKNSCKVHEIILKQCVAEQHFKIRETNRPF